MRKIISFLFLFIIISIAAGSAGINKKDSADNILNSSLKQAEESNKPVMVIFHASWCIWCRHLEDALNSPELKKIINDHFVIAYIDVLERKEKKEELENPGGENIMNDLGGKNAGLPFYVFLNSKGKKIANSNAMPKDQNIGYPASNSEITAFTSLLKKSSNRLTDKQINAVKDYLKKAAPKH
ncbi:MAG: thioredoxin family protein [Ignavibacteriaceae bacterium]